MTARTDTRTRAARLQLTARLDLASHGADLLHSKEEALRRERIRLEGHVTRTKNRWEHSCREASTWLLRARALGASDELASLVTSEPAPATVTPHWQTSMGITYPGSVDTTAGPEPTVTSTSALRPTIDAFRLALSTAADHASTTAALTRLDNELADTRRRRRAIEQRLLPRLESTLHDLDLYLDEQDRDDALRVHIATDPDRTARP